MKLTKAIYISALLLLGAIGYAQLQGANLFANLENDMRTGKAAPQDYAVMRDLYMSAPDDRELTRQIMRSAVVAGSDKALLLIAAQNARIIEQNERIVKLLESRK